MTIRLSPEHGLNPSVALCYFCQEPKGLALLGAMSPARRDRLFGPGHKSPMDTPTSAEAPRQATYDEEPCDACKKLMELGVILISYDPAQSGEDPRNPWRTGGWCVVRDDGVRRLLDDKETKLLDAILERRFVFVEDKVWDAVGLPRGPQKGESTDDEGGLEGETTEPGGEPPG